MKGKMKTFETRDLYLSAYMVQNGFNLKGLKASDNIVYFQFEDSSDREEIVMKFFNGQATVEPGSYMDAIKRLRILVKNKLHEVSKK